QGSPPWMRRMRKAAEVKARDAAVLMLFGRGGQARTEAGQAENRRLTELGVADVDIVLLQRAATLRHHPGQVAFPGGRRDPEDASMTAAALREAEEEAGIAPSTVEVLGAMDPLYIPVSGFEVTPVIGYWAQPGAVQVMDERESYSVYRVSIADIVAPAQRGTFYRPDLKITTTDIDVGILNVWVLVAMDPLYIPVIGFEVTPVIGYWAQPGAVQVMDERESYSVYRVSIADLVAPANRGTFSRPDLKITTPAFDVGVLKVWGFTAGVLDYALDHLGWAGDWDAGVPIEIDD